MNFAAVINYQKKRAFISLASFAKSDQGYMALTCYLFSGPKMNVVNWNKNQ